MRVEAHDIMASLNVNGCICGVSTLHGLNFVVGIVGQTCGRDHVAAVYERGFRENVSTSWKVRRATDVENEISRSISFHVRQFNPSKSQGSTYPSSDTQPDSAWAGRACNPESPRA